MKIENSGGPTVPTPEEALAALREADRVRAVFERTTLPWWFSCALAATTAANCLVQRLPGRWTLLALLPLLAATTVLCVVGLRKAGFMPRPRGVRLAVVAVTLVICTTAFAPGALLEERYGHAWGWYLAAAANGAATLGCDLFHRTRRLPSRDAAR